MITLAYKTSDGFARALPSVDLDFVLNGCKVFILVNTSRMTTGMIIKRDNKTFVSLDGKNIEVINGERYTDEVFYYGAKLSV